MAMMKNNNAPSSPFGMLLRKGIQVFVASTEFEFDVSCNFLLLLRLRLHLDFTHTYPRTTHKPLLQIDKQFKLKESEVNPNSCPTKCGLVPSFYFVSERHIMLWNLLYWQGKRTQLGHGQHNTGTDVRTAEEQFSRSMNYSKINTSVSKHFSDQNCYLPCSQSECWFHLKKCDESFPVESFPSNALELQQKWLRILEETAASISRGLTKTETPFQRRKHSDYEFFLTRQR